VNDVPEHLPDDHLSPVFPEQEAGIAARETAQSLSDVIALGWAIARLFSFRSYPGSPAPSDERDHLPAFEALDDRFKIGVEVARLGNLIDRLDIDDVATLEPAPPDPEFRASVTRCHVDILRQLAAASLSLAELRAYELGVSLGEVSSRGGTEERPHSRQIRLEQLARIQALLDELVSRLPRHAAPAVSASAQLWSERIQGSDMAASQGFGSALEHQSEMWVVVLCGEADPLEALDGDDAEAITRGELSGRELETALGEAITHLPSAEA
jgi:hypothetical protein